MDFSVKLNAPESFNVKMEKAQESIVSVGKNIFNRVDQKQSDLSQNDASQVDFVNNKSTKYLLNEGEDGSSPYATEDYVIKNGGKIDSISVNGEEQIINNKNVEISVPTAAGDVNALPDTTKYGASLSLTIDNSTYVIIAQLKDQKGNNLGNAQKIDLPLESVVVDGSLDEETREVVLTLKNGSEVRFSVSDLVNGLASQKDLDSLRATVSTLSIGVNNLSNAKLNKFIANDNVVPRMDSSSGHLQSSQVTIDDSGALNAKKYYINGVSFSALTTGDSGYLSIGSSTYLTRITSKNKPKWFKDGVEQGTFTMDSDIPAWAKEANKPEYNYSEIKNTPNIPDGAKLYSITGQNTDGAMTQKATTDELDKKLEYVEESIASGTPNPLANYYTKSETNDLIYNENLLVNGDFRINQRGLTKYKAYGNSVNVYTADMWRINYGTELTINLSSITLKIIQQYAAMLQYVQNFEDLKGKTLTLSAKVLNVSGSGLFLRAADGVNNPAIHIAGSGITKLTFTMPTDATQLSIQIFNASSAGTEMVVDIEYIKLEIGDTATPNIPRPYAQELAMCQMPLPADKWGLSTTYSNENILINGDFRVNQRGFTSTTTNVYTVDRWKLARANTSATLNDDGTITLGSVSGGTQNTLFCQYIEEKDYKKLLGEPVVMSAMVSTDDGASYQIHTMHTILPETLPTTALNNEISIYNASNVRVGTIRIYWTGSKFEIDFICLLNQSLRIKWVKFEKGYVATAFSPRPYAEELALCKRYFRNVYANEQFYIARNSSEVRTSVNIQMRTTPTTSNIKPVGLLKIFQIGSSTLDSTQSSAKINVFEINANSLNLGFPNFSGLTQGSVCMGTSNNIIATIDAEI